MWAFLLSSFAAGTLATLFRPVLAAGTRVAGGVLVRWNMAPDWLRRAATAGGLVAGADILIPDSFIDPLGLPDVYPSGGSAPEMPTGAQIVKRWEANGVQFVRLGDGRMGAFSKRRGTWKFWRPKKPIVMYSGGASDLKTLLKADRAADRQLKKLKKVIDRRFPRRSRGRQSPRTIIESGPGHVVTT